MIQGGGDDLDNLADCRCLLVAHVVGLAGRGLWPVNTTQQRLGGVLTIRSSTGRQPGVGHHDRAASVQDPAHDQPLARQQLTGPVDQRVTKVGGGWVVGEHHLLAFENLDDLAHLVAFDLHTVFSGR